MYKFVRWNSCDRVESRRGRRVTRSMMSWSWAMKFFCLGPLYTLISCEFKGEALSSNNHGSYVDKNVSIDCLSCEIEIFISLYVEVCHYLWWIIIPKRLEEVFISYNKTKNKDELICWNKFFKSYFKSFPMDYELVFFNLFKI